MQATLKETLELIGKLDNSAGDNSPRARFHNYLKTYITEVEFESKKRQILGL